jgi:cyanophycin synthetase
MRILSSRAIEGRNVHSHYPVIEVLVDLEEYADRQTNEIAGFGETLVECLPGIASHHCGVGAPGGFLLRVSEGTYFGHMIEHVALELMIAAGQAVMYGKTRRVRGSVYKIVFEYECKESGLYAARAAPEVVKQMANGQRPDVAGHISQIRSLAWKHQLGPSTMAIAKAAEDRGIPWMRLGSTSVLQLGYGSKQRFVEATISGRTSCVSVDIACDKVLTKLLLEEAGIPVPQGGLAGDEEQALRVATELGYPLVTKPRDGNQGRGVSVNLRTEEELLKGFRTARALNEEVVVERFIQGRHYRILVVGGKMSAAAERLPAFVIGDGKHTVARLVEITNNDPMRGDEHELPLTRIKIDDVAKHVLSRQSLSLESVPGRGNLVYLRDNANLSTGGVAIDVTDEVHPENVKMAIRAAEILGLDIAGVDVITDHISLPADSTGGVVIEVNAAPGIRMHLFPWKGRRREVGRHIVDHLFPGGNGRIPVVAVTGTNGKTTTVRMISTVLAEAGYHVGMTCTDGVFINGDCIMKADASGPKSARTVLRSPKVDAAVLETARGGLMRDGLAFDRCDVAVITNISDDHLGQDGILCLEDLALAKALVVEAVTRKGHAVINADDPVSLSIADRASGRLVLFSAQPDNLAVRKHIMAGGRAVVLKNGHITWAAQDKTTKIVAVESIPCTLGGAASFNVENALATVAACCALDIDADTIALALSQFHADARTNPGRLNIIESGGFTVVLDYGHNVPALEASVAAARRLITSNREQPSRLIGVVASPGDRHDDRIVALGRAAAGVFSLVVIKEDHDLRGRKPGETARLLAKGALEVAPSESVKVVLDESEAIREALKACTRNDLLVIYYEEYDHAYQSIMKWTQEMTPAPEGSWPKATVGAVPLATGAQESVSGRRAR